MAKYRKIREPQPPAPDEVEYEFTVTRIDTDKGSYELVDDSTPPTPKGKQ